MFGHMCPAKKKKTSARVVRRTFVHVVIIKWGGGRGGCGSGHTFRLLCQSQNSVKVGSQPF